MKGWFESTAPSVRIGGLRGRANRVKVAVPRRYDRCPARAPEEKRMRVLMRSVVICLMAVAAIGMTAGAALSVRGTIVDSSGGVLPGVTVQLKAGGQVVATVVTNSDGRFTIENVAPGEYDLVAELSGFKPTVERLRVLDGAGPAPLSIRMEVSSVAETVTVTAASPLVEAQTASRSGRRQKKDPWSALAAPSRPPSTAIYSPITDNGFRRVADAPLSTFSVDVDTASYTNVRRFLTAGTLPPPDAVRIEELINYFHFDYPDAHDGRPFSVTTEVGPCPWDDRHALALVGLQTRRIALEATPPRNLVFLLDVSGSMEPQNRLPLIQSAMLMLADTLRAEDSVAVVVYAGASGVALPATSGDHHDAIASAITRLRAGGSTNGAEGIRLAYDIASRHFVKGGIKRVILATDGDFNVGVTSPADLVKLIEGERKSGVFLSVLGVGDDNLNDGTMEKLADAGNGNYAYLDTLAEARRVLVQQASATLVTVAKDVKVQVEFNPRHVDGYRLIGYEDRVLANEDFRDDRKDAGDMGAGHSVTALYEIVPAGRGRDLPTVDALKYQQPAVATGALAAELLTVKLRYKAPDGEKSTPMDVPVRASSAAATANLRFAAAVAEFGMLLRNSPYKSRATWTQVEELATANRGEDADGYRAEFVRLAGVAASLARRPSATLER
jgi:Ca-activated chloride channel family protein